MKFRFISDYVETFNVGRMCKLLNVSRSGLLCLEDASRKPQESRKPNSGGSNAVAACQQPRDLWGTADPPASERNDDGVRCGRNRVARIMRVAGMRSRTRKNFKATTDSGHSLPVAPNLLNQGFSAEAPDTA